MVRSCSCRSSAAATSAGGRAVPPSLAGASLPVWHTLVAQLGMAECSCSAWRKRASAALTCIYPRATQPVSSAGRARENPLIPWFSGAAFHPARSLRRRRSASLPPGARSARLPKTRAELAAQLVRASERLGATRTPLAGRWHTLGGVGTHWRMLATALDMLAGRKMKALEGALGTHALRIWALRPADADVAWHE